MLNVKIATPSNKIFEGELEQISIQTIDGVVTILPNHVPFMTSIENGYVKFNEETIEFSKGTVILDDENNLKILGC